MKMSDLTVCEPQIKTQVICSLIFVLFWLKQNRGLAPMAVIVVYVIISHCLPYTEFRLERRMVFAFYIAASRDDPSLYL